MHVCMHLYMSPKGACATLYKHVYGAWPNSSMYVYSVWPKSTMCVRDYLLSDIVSKNLNVLKQSAFQLANGSNKQRSDCAFQLANGSNEQSMRFSCVSNVPVRTSPLGYFLFVSVNRLYFQYIFPPCDCFMCASVHISGL